MIIVVEVQLDEDLVLVGVKNLSIDKYRKQLGYLYLAHHFGPHFALQVTVRNH